MASQSQPGSDAILVKLWGPEPSSALERYLWDRCYKFAMPLPEPGSMDHVESVRTFSDPAEVTPPSPSATLVGENPSDKWQIETLDDHDIATDIAGLQLGHQMHIKAEPRITAARYSRGRLTQLTSGSLRVTSAPAVHWKSQGYMMILNITETVPDEDVDLAGAPVLNNHFKLLMDTGSSINWVLGSGYLEVEKMANKRARPAADVIANSDVKAPREADSQPYRHRPLGDSRLPPPLQPPPAYGLHAQEQSGVQSATHPQREWPGHQGRVHQPVPQAVLPTSLPPNQPLHHSHSHSRQQPIIHPTTGYQQMPPVQWLQLPLAHGPQPPSMQWLQLPSVQGPQPPSVQWSHPAGPLPPQQRSQTGFQESYSQFNQRPPHTMPPVPGPPSQLPPPAQRQQPVIQASRSRSGVAQGSLQQAMPQIPPSRPVPAKPAKPAKPAPPHPNQPPTQSSQHQQSHHMPTPSQQQPLPESVGTAPRREMNREEPPQPSNPLLQGSEEAPPPQPTSTSTRVIDGLTVRAWKDVDRRDRTANVGRPDHSMLANPPVVLYEPGSVAIDDHVVHHKVTYMDRSIVHLALVPEAFIVEIIDCYQWMGNGRALKLSPLSIPLNFGAAFAVSYWIDRSKYDGILGLGLLDVQQGFEDSGVSTFLAVLKEKLKLSSSREHAHYIVMYLALRSPTVSLSALIESWIAWVDWPLEAKPGWCKAIAVIPYRRAQANVTKAFSHWTVLLLGMRLLKRSSGPQSPYELVPNGDFASGFPADGTSGVEVVLDTGASLSYVASQVLTQIKTTLFPCTQNHGLSGGGIPFIVSDEQWDRSFIMEYTFRGKDGANVVVYGDADPFLCTRNPHAPSQPFREGLLRNVDSIRTAEDIEIPWINSRRWLFGANFFHTMYVGLCKPRTPISGEPYVLLAPQWAGEVEKYRLPAVVD